MKLLTVLFCVCCYGQGVVPSSQWLIPNGQWGVGNNDISCIRPYDAYVANGLLNLVTEQKTTFCEGGTTYPGQTQTFTVGNVVAKTFNFQYGVVKVRAKLPGIGIHAGIWMLSSACQAAQTGGDAGIPCPGHAEIDILDYLPLSFTPTTGTCGFYNGSFWQQPSYTYDPTQWHVYTLIWTSTTLTWKLDGVTKCTISPSTSENMFPWLTVEVDNSISGRAPSYPITMFVDYEHICSDPTAVCDDGDPTMIFQDDFGGPINSRVERGKVTIR